MRSQLQLPAVQQLHWYCPCYDWRYDQPRQFVSTNQPIHSFYIIRSYQDIYKSKQSCSATTYAEPHFVPHTGVWKITSCLLGIPPYVPPGAASLPFVISLVPTTSSLACRPASPGSVAYLRSVPRRRRLLLLSRASVAAQRPITRWTARRCWRPMWRGATSLRVGRQALRQEAPTALGTRRQLYNALTAACGTFVSIVMAPWAVHLRFPPAVPSHQLWEACRD